MARKSKKKIRAKISRKKKVKPEVILLFIGVAIISFILLGLLGSSAGWFNFHEPEKFELKDECGLILGNLVHQIRSEGECRNKCVNECDVREMDFVKFYFEENLGDCHNCECWCE